MIGFGTTGRGVAGQGVLSLMARAAHERTAEEVFSAAAGLWAAAAHRLVYIDCVHVLFVERHLEEVLCVLFV